MKLAGRVSPMAVGLVFAPMASTISVPSYIKGYVYSVNMRGRLLMALTQIKGTVMQPRMGRPPLHVKETKVRLTDEQRRRITALVGERGMAAFIREAVDAELDRREKAPSPGPQG